MLGAVSYPITIVELNTYLEDADRVLTEDRHDRLKEILAFNPEHGDLIPNTGGVRQFVWQVEGGGDEEIQIVYFYRDLEMPLFMVAVCFEPFEEFDASACAEMKSLAEQLVAEYDRQKARIVAGKSLA